MSILSEIIDNIRAQWSHEPKYATHRGKEMPFTLRCSLNEGKKLPDLSIREVKLPSSLELFYSLSNGAELFKDEEYGQWGLKIYDLNSLNEATEYYKNERKNDYLKGDLIIGEFYGDSECLLVRCDPESEDYGLVLVVLPIDPRDEWYIVARDFEEFIEKFYIYQGDKFWELQNHSPIIN